MHSCEVQKQMKGIHAQLKPGSPSSIFPVKITADFKRTSFRSPNVWQITLPIRPKPKEGSMELNSYLPVREHDSNSVANAQNWLTAQNQYETTYTPGCYADAVSRIFSLYVNEALDRLIPLLRVATDFVCGPQTEIGAPIWKGIRGPYRAWINGLHTWRDENGTLARQVIEQALDEFGHQDDDSAYHHTRKMSYCFWARICDLDRKVELCTVPGAGNLAGFQALCTEFYSLCLYAWDSLMISMINDVRMLTDDSALSHELRPGRTLKAILREGKLFAVVFDEEMLNTALKSLVRKPTADPRIISRSRRLGLKKDRRFPGGPKTGTKEGG